MRKLSVNTFLGLAAVAGPYCKGHSAQLCSGCAAPGPQQAQLWDLGGCRKEQWLQDLPHARRSDPTEREKCIMVINGCTYPLCLVTMGKLSDPEGE